MRCTPHLYRILPGPSTLEGITISKAIVATLASAGLTCSVMRAELRRSRRDADTLGYVEVVGRRLRRLVDRGSADDLRKASAKFVDLDEISYTIVAFLRKVRSREGPEHLPSAKSEALSQNANQRSVVQSRGKDEASRARRTSCRSSPSPQAAPVVQGTKKKRRDSDDVEIVDELMPKKNVRGKI